MITTSTGLLLLVVGIMLGIVIGAIVMNRVATRSLNTAQRLLDYSKPPVVLKSVNNRPEYIGDDPDTIRSRHEITPIVDTED